MDFNERLGWLILGALVGFVLGYIVRSLREIREDVVVIKDEVDEIDVIVKTKRDQSRADDGFMHIRFLRDIAVLIALLVTVWAAFASQKSSNEVKHQQNQIDQITVCTSEYLARTIRVLNLRTDAVQARADANLELQKAQSKFFKLLLEIPPLPAVDRREAADDYVKSLNKFIEISDTTKQAGESDPYPTNAEYQACLNQ